MRVKVGVPVMPVVTFMLMKVGKVHADQVDRTESHASFRQHLVSEGAHLAACAFQQNAFKAVLMVEPDRVGVDDEVMMGVLHVG